MSKILIIDDDVDLVAVEKAVLRERRLQSYHRRKRQGRISPGQKRKTGS